MPIEHVAVWTENLERLRSFYEAYFEAQAGAKYVNTWLPEPEGLCSLSPPASAAGKSG